MLARTNSVRERENLSGFFEKSMARDSHLGHSASPKAPLPLPTASITTSFLLMVSTRQQARVRKCREENPPLAGNDNEHEEQTPDSRKTRGMKFAETTIGGKQQQESRAYETARLSRFLNMPIDILHEVRRSPLYSRVP